MLCCLLVGGGSWHCSGFGLLVGGLTVFVWCFVLLDTIAFNSVDMVLLCGFACWVVFI